MTFGYLCTPYSNYSSGHEAAFREAARIAAWLAVRGIIVYCPIAHSHPLAESGLLPKTGHDLWVSLDAPFVAAASYCVVAKMPGWEESRGVQHEIKIFTECGKPVFYMEIPE